MHNALPSALALEEVQVLDEMKSRIQHPLEILFLQVVQCQVRALSMGNWFPVRYVFTALLVLPYYSTGAALLLLGS